MKICDSRQQFNEECYRLVERVARDLELDGKLTEIVLVAGLPSLMSSLKELQGGKLTLRLCSPSPKPDEVYHECMHAQDMLDSLFQFNQELHNGLRQDQYKSVRVETLWNLYIDSRLERWGKPGESRETRQELFGDSFPELTQLQQEKMVEEWWNRERAVYPEIYAAADIPDDRRAFIEREIDQNVEFV